MSTSKKDGPMSEKPKTASQGRFTCRLYSSWSLPSTLVDLNDEASFSAFLNAAGYMPGSKRQPGGRPLQYQIVRPFTPSATPGGRGCDATEDLTQPVS